MTYPGKPEWATGGSANLDEQHAQSAENGFYHGSRVAPDQINQWRHQVAESLRNVASIASHTPIRGIKDGSAGAYTPPAFDFLSACKNHVHGCFDTNDPRHIHTLICSDPTGGLANGACEVNSQGQYAWTGTLTSGASTDFALAGTPDINGIGINTSSDRVIACDSGTTGLYYSSDYGAWAGWTTGTDTTGWDCYGVKYDPASGYWVVLKSTAIYAGNAINNTLTLRRSVTIGQKSNVAYSYHAAGDLYPGDAGNPYWMMIPASGAAGDFHRAINGYDWDQGWAPTTAGYTLKPQDDNCLAYSRFADAGDTQGRWGLIVPAGTTTTGQTFVYSDDSGENWTEVTDAFGVDADSSLTSSSTIVDFKLTCDGWGTWWASAQATVDAYGTGSTRIYGRQRIWCSNDNGLTWKRLLLSAVHERSGDSDNEIRACTDYLGIGFGTSLWYGDGAFHYAGIGYRDTFTPAAGSIHYSSLRLWQD